MRIRVLVAKSRVEEVKELIRKYSDTAKLVEEVSLTNNNRLDYEVSINKSNEEALRKKLMSMSYVKFFELNEMKLVRE